MSWVKVHVKRLLLQDTSFTRMIVALGLVTLGAAMLCGLGLGAPGYTLLGDESSLRIWGSVYFVTGSAGVYSAVVPRLNYWLRLSLCLLGMWLWAFIAFAQFADNATPTRLLLILPAVVESCTLLRILVFGRREP